MQVNQSKLDNLTHVYPPGTDSLAAFQISTLFVERFQRELPLHIWFGANTLSDIIQYFHGGNSGDFLTSSHKQLALTDLAREVPVRPEMLSPQNISAG